MKKLRLFAMMLAAMWLIASCDTEKVITPEELPEGAKTYIEKRYPGAQILYVKKESKLFQTSYEVRLDNLMEMKFDGDGTLVDLDVDD